jgi:hypothetical protein
MAILAGTMNDKQVIEMVPQADQAEPDMLPYETPTLRDFGTVAELTHGTFAGVGVDSAVYS